LKQQRRTATSAFLLFGVALALVIPTILVFLPKAGLSYLW